MTNQEALNIVVDHLLSDKMFTLKPEFNNVSYHEVPKLRYRYLSGHKCLIGSLIADDKYTSDLEDFQVVNLIEYTRSLGEESQISKAFLIRLESVNSHVRSIAARQGDWINDGAKMLIQLARDLDLVAPDQLKNLLLLV